MSSNRNPEHNSKIPDIAINVDKPLESEKKPSPNKKPKLPEHYSEIKEGQLYAISEHTSICIKPYSGPPITLSDGIRINSNTLIAEMHISGLEKYKDESDRAIYKKILIDFLHALIFLSSHISKEPLQNIAAFTGLTYLAGVKISSLLGFDQFEPSKEEQMEEAVRGFNLTPDKLHISQEEFLRKMERTKRFWISALKIKEQENQYRQLLDKYSSS